MKAAAEGAREIARDADDDRPARRRKGGEKEPERGPFKPAQQVKNERGHKAQGGDDNGEKLFEVPLLFDGRVAVDDLHLFKVRDHVDRPRQRGRLFVVERDALRDEVHGDLGEPVRRRELLLQFRRARRAVQVAYFDDLVHTHSPSDSAEASDQYLNKYS